MGMTDPVLDIVGRRTLDQLLEWAARGRERDVFILLADGREVRFGEFLAQRREAETMLRAAAIRCGRPSPVCAKCGALEGRRANEIRLPSLAAATDRRRYLRCHDR